MRSAIGSAVRLAIRSDSRTRILKIAQKKTMAMERVHKILDLVEELVWS